MKSKGDVNAQKMRRYYRHRKIVDDYRKNHPCMVCGDSNYWRLDFHHIDPNTKEMCVSKMLHLSKTRFIREIQKCIVLCANCHRDVHYKKSEKYFEIKKEILPLFPEI